MHDFDIKHQDNRSHCLNHCWSIQSHTIRPAARFPPWWVPGGGGTIASSVASAGKRSSRAGFCDLLIFNVSQRAFRNFSQESPSCLSKYPRCSDSVHLRTVYPMGKGWTAWKSVVGALEAINGREKIHLWSTQMGKGWTVWKTRAVIGSHQWWIKKQWHLITRSSFPVGTTCSGKRNHHIMKKPSSLKHCLFDHWSKPAWLSWLLKSTWWNGNGYGFMDGFIMNILLHIIAVRHNLPREDTWFLAISNSEREREKNKKNSSRPPKPSVIHLFVLKDLESMRAKNDGAGGNPVTQDLNDLTRKVFMPNPQQFLKGCDLPIQSTWRSEWGRYTCVIIKVMPQEKCCVSAMVDQ